MTQYTSPNGTTSIALIRATLMRPIAFHRIFRDIGESTVAGLFLSQAWYWSGKIPDDRDGWFYKTAAEWEEETGLSRREQETARKQLRTVGVLHEQRRGVPATLWFQLDLDVIARLIVSETCTSLNGASRQSGMAHPANLYTETTDSRHITVLGLTRCYHRGNIRIADEELPH